MRAYLDALQKGTWRGPEAPIPPIVLAALRPRMASLAVERTAGAYPYFTTTQHVKTIHQQMGPEPFLAADLPIVHADSRSAA